jgi:hypothetical protein
VRLIRKVANYLDGIDVSRYSVGDIVELHALEAALLIAEGWAIGEHTERAAEDRRAQSDRRQQAEPPRQPTPAIAGLESGIRHSVLRLRQMRDEIDQRRAAANLQRRAQDIIREELHDSRAKTIRSGCSID